MKIFTCENSLSFCLVNRLQHKVHSLVMNRNYDLDSKLT